MQINRLGIGEQAGVHHKQLRSANQTARRRTPPVCKPVNDGVLLLFGMPLDTNHARAELQISQLTRPSPLRQLNCSLETRHERERDLRNRSDQPVHSFRATIEARTFS